MNAMTLWSLLGTFGLMILLLSGLSAGAPPSCPGHPSCKDDGNDGGGGGDIEVCTDKFPSFTFVRQKKGKTLAHELFVASSEGCRVEKLADIKAGAGPAFSYGNGKGLIAWAQGFETYDLHVLRFSVDESSDARPITSNSGPELILATQQPTEADTTIEYFFDVDVWTDYSSADDSVELIAFYALLDFAGGSGEAGQARSIEVLDLAQPATPNVIWSLTSDEANACVGEGPSFDPRNAGGHLCLLPEGGVDFSETAERIYFHSHSPGPFEHRWVAQNRLPRPTDGWASGAALPDLLYASQTWDCVADAMPFGDDSLLIEVPGQGIQEVMVANACVGFQKSGKSLRDQRLYFLDVEACAADPDALWQNCHLDVPALYSGQIHGRGASWREDGEVVYGGFESKTLDSIRAFNPGDSSVINDRELLGTGGGADTSQ